MVDVNVSVRNIVCAAKVLDEIPVHVLLRIVDI